MCGIAGILTSIADQPIARVHLKAILACPDLKLEIDPYAVEDYLTYDFIPGERSIFQHSEAVARTCPVSLH